MPADDQLRKAVDAALLPLTVSLGGAGVEDVHWLPDRDGEPVVWIRVATEIERVALQTNSWVLPQVQMILTRLGVPYASVAALRLEFTSREAEDDLLKDR